MSKEATSLSADHSWRGTSVENNKGGAVFDMDFW